MPVLVDTSGMLALTDVDSSDHEVVRRFVAAERGSLLVPVTVLPEVDYLVLNRFGVRVELAALRAVSTGEFELQELTIEDLRRSLEIIEQYADSRVGIVDASIVAIAERLRITRILTLDQRHFRMFRPRHCPAFELVP